MRKTITPIVAIVLLTLMTVGASVLAFIWVGSVQSTTQERVGAAIESAPGSSNTRLNIISMRGDGVTIQNNGYSSVGSVMLLVDGILEEHDLTTPVGPGQASLVSFNQALEVNRAHTVGVAVAGSVTSTTTVNAKQATLDAGYVEPTGAPQGCGSNTLYKPSALLEPTWMLDVYTHGYYGHNYSVSGSKYVCRVDFMTTANTGAGDVNVYVIETDPSGAGFNVLGLTPDGSVPVSAGTQATYSVLINKQVTDEFYVLLNADNSTSTLIRMALSINTATPGDREAYYCADALGAPPGGCSAGNGLWTTQDFIDAAFLTSELASNMIIHVDSDGTCDDVCSLNNYCSSGSCTSWNVLCNTDCDGSCPGVDCYGIDPDCDSEGNATLECCGNSVCGVGETCSSCPGDCTCEWPNTCCSGNCVNLNNDTSFCGACNVSCTSTAFCNYGTCTECGGYDDQCVNVACFGIDPECDASGNWQESCGNGYCNVTAGENLTTCPADCHKYVTSFSNGEYYGVIPFTGAGTNSTMSLRVPKNATASSASIMIRGEPDTEKYGYTGFIDLYGSRVYEVQLDGNYLYVPESNMKNTGFLIYDVSDKSNPVMITNYSNFNYSNFVFVLDDILYTSGQVAWPARVRIFNVSDVYNPVELASTSDSVGTQDGWAVHKGAEDYLFTIGGSFIWASNVTDKSSIVNVDSINLGTSAYHIEVEGDYAYVLGGAANILNIVNISDPTNMNVVYTNTSTYNPVQGSLNLFVENSIVYFTAGSYGLMIINATNKLSPSHLSGVPGYYYDVHKSGNYLYLASMYPNDDIRIVDVSDVSNPVLLNYSRGASGNSVDSVYVSGDYIYLASYAGIDIINKNGKTISKVGESSFFTDARGLYVMDNYAYVACNNAPPLRIFDVTTKSNPYSYSNVSLSGTGRDVFLLDNNIGYSVNNELVSINISNPASVTQIDVSDRSPGGYDLMVIGDYAYTSGGVSIFSVDNINNLKNVSSIQVNNIAGLYVQGDYAYVPQRNPEWSMHVIDVSDRYAPANVTFLYMDNDEEDVFVRGNTAYLMGSRFHTVDISNPASPSIINEDYDGGYKSYVLGNLAFKVQGDEILTIFDVSDVSDPKPVIHGLLSSDYDADLNLYEIFVVGDYAYVADQTGGAGLIIVYLGDLTYPNNPSIDLGSDNQYKWSYTNGENYGWRTINITSDLNDAISDCTPDGQGYCTIPVSVAAASGSGSIYLENIFVAYNEE